jgi:hypothetical protein
VEMSKYGYYDIDTVFTFGKHKGKSVRFVIYNDTKYIEWCISENLVEFDNKVLLKLEDERYLKERR